MSASLSGAEPILTPSPTASRLARRRKRIVFEKAIELVLFLAALVSVFTTIGIVYVLVKESVLFFQRVSFGTITNDDKTPVEITKDRQFTGRQEDIQPF